MGVYKKGVYDDNQIHNLNFSVAEINLKTNTENLSGFDKKSYILAVEDAKTDGFTQGYDEGYRKGYDEGRIALEDEKQQFYLNVEADKLNLNLLLQKESIGYINKFGKDISDIITSSINKIFMDAISNEIVAINYFETLMNRIKQEYDSFTVFMNSETVSKLASVVESLNINVTIDDKIGVLDFVIKTETEFLEFYINDEFEKIINLFK